MASKNTPRAILLIDGEPLIRWALSSALSQAGHEVVAASDGDEGIRAVVTASRPFDVIFQDFRLPDSNDFRLLTAIRMWTPVSAVVLMTASHPPDVITKAHPLGVYRVINKPFDVTDVQNIVAAAPTVSTNMEVVSMAQLAVIASPFQCRWIPPGTEMRLEQWTYAICLRSRDRPRVVSEDECSRCACWELSTDRVSQVCREHDQRGRHRSTFVV